MKRHSQNPVNEIDARHTKATINIPSTWYEVRINESMRRSGNDQEAPRCSADTDTVCGTDREKDELLVDEALVRHRLHVVVCVRARLEGAQPVLSVLHCSQREADTAAKKDIYQ